MWTPKEKINLSGNSTSYGHEILHGARGDKPFGSHGVHRKI